jgi:rhodanese-related sulfurtransferase
MNGYKEVNASELFDMLAHQKINLVDVRNQDEVLRGIIAGAKHVPLATLPIHVKSLDGTEPLVIYCHSGVRSAQAAAYMVSKGRRDVYNLSGGVIAWARAGLPFVQM